MKDFADENEVIEALTSGGSDRVAAAIELGYLKTPAARSALLEALLTETEGRPFTAVCAGLELLDDPTIEAALFDRLASVPEDLVYELCQVISRVIGTTPYLPLDASPEERRAAWLGLRDAEQSGCRIELEPDGDYHRMRVIGGTGRLRLDFEPPPRGTSNWPRFFMSLQVGREPAYRAGSWCPTCELWLSLLGWPKLKAAEANAAMSKSVQSELQPDSELLNTWRPLLGELTSGEYLAAAFDFHVERVVDGESSYFTTRMKHRTTDDPWYEEPEPEDLGSATLPGTQYFQGPRFVSGEMPTYWVVMPSQPLDELDEAKVCEYETRIRRGEFPTVVVLGWVDIRYVEAQFNERFVTLYVLDGHHKLAAYARSRRSAHFVGVFMPDYPALQRSREVLDQLSTWDT